jgi:hypothetical protein
LAGERRVTAFIAAKAPWQLHGALARLALLPPTTTTAALLPSRGTQATTPTESKASVAAAAAVPTPTPAVGNQPELKTVSLDSLPVLGSEPAAAPQPAPARAARASSHEAAPTRARDATPSRSARHAAADDDAEPAPKRAKAEPEAEPAPKRAKAEPALPPASPNEGFLKAAIREAIIADAKKGK